jgi:hypothetical protein
MKRNILSVLPILLLLVQVQVSSAQITANGDTLAKRLDEMDVEHHWIAGEHVNWRTGDPDGKPVTGDGLHTHCSAFVAAFCQRMGIYILRPPEHGQKFLANAQFDWLFDQGKENGWTEVKDAKEAQHLANQGLVVVATYKNHKDDKPGHIAVVRPDPKPDRLIRFEGPQVVQAGKNNHNSIPLKEGFKGHPSAWENQEVRYFSHAVE